MQVVKIIVEGGCVLDVIGLPPGFTYIVEDHDIYDEDDTWDLRETEDQDYFDNSGGNEDDAP